VLLLIGLDMSIYRGRAAKVVCVVVICLLAWGWFILWRLSTIRTLPPYVEAISVIRCNKVIDDVLGSRIDPGFLVQYRIERDLLGRSIYLVIPLQGTDIKAYAHVKAHERNGIWKLNRIEVFLIDGSILDIM
jgi:hypothetical protein